MGIYDREYYRDETSGSGWLNGVTPAVKGLVAVNIAVFLAQWVFPTLRLDDWLAASSQDIFEKGRVFQLLSAPFFHAGGWHIAMNMIVLWMFGREVERIYGTVDFLAMYLTAAVLSTLAWAVIDYFRLGTGGVMLGASGAVMAVFVVYAMYYPRREVLLFFVLPVQIWLLLVLFIAFDFLMLLRQGQGVGMNAGTAYAAHLGGALYGYLFKAQDLRISRLRQMFRLGPRLKVFVPQPRERGKAGRSRETNRTNPVSTPSARPSVNLVFPEEQLEQQVDEILAKIAREGRGGLSDEENRILLEASRRAKIKRSDRL